MKTQLQAIQPPLNDSELAQIDLTRYAHYPEMLFLHVIVQRGSFWHIALLQLDRGKLRYSSVSPKKFALEKDARTTCEREHYQMSHLFKVLLPNFDIQPVWFT